MSALPPVLALLLCQAVAAAGGEERQILRARRGRAVPARGSRLGRVSGGVSEEFGGLVCGKVGKLTYRCLLGKGPLQEKTVGTTNHFF